MGPDVFQTEMFDSGSPKCVFWKGINPDTSVIIRDSHSAFPLSIISAKD